ncbi:hypothetical protein PO909_032078 [Leuciscus waleckii]
MRSPQVRLLGLSNDFHSRVKRCKDPQICVLISTAHLQGDGHILSSDDGMLLIGPMDHKHSSQCILTAVPSSPSVSITKA